jgi:hypothetical protein
MGISWEKLGTFSIVNEIVIKIFGNLVGITWEKVSYFKKKSKLIL